MGKHHDPPADVDSDFMQEILERNLAADSALTILAWNDLLALDPSLRPADPAEERINTPGTESPRNWRWRMPNTLEDLGGRDDLNARTRAMLARRRARPFG